jgi:hypothetical protein
MLDANGVELTETIILKKFDESNLEEPVEIIELCDGKIVNHWIKEEGEEKYATT